MTVADLRELPPVRGKLIFPQFSDKGNMKHLLGLQLLHLFKYAELTEVVRQNNKLFIDLLKKVRVGNVDDDGENLLKARFIHESDENYPKAALYIYAKNESVMKRSEAVLNELPGELYRIEANDKIPDNCRYSLTLTQAAQNQKQINTGGLAKFLKLKTDAKVMLTINTDIQDRLINGHTGIIMHIEFAQGTARKVFKFFDEQGLSKEMRSYYLGRQNSWVSLEKCENGISTKKGSASSSSVLNFH